MGWDARDETGRRLTGRGATGPAAGRPQGLMAEAFGVDPATTSGAGIRRWPAAGWPGLSRPPRGPKQASKLIPEAAERIQRVAAPACMPMPRFRP
jgi:hypothetical protein